EVPDGDLGDDAVPLIEEARGRRSTELEEHLAILLQLWVEHLRGRREWRGCDLSELPRLATGLGPRFRAGLRASLGTAGRRPGGASLRKFGLRLVQLAREPVHLDVLVRGNPVPQRLHYLLLRALPHLP